MHVIAQVRIGPSSCSLLLDLTRIPPLKKWTLSEIRFSFTDPRRSATITPSLLYKSAWTSHILTETHWLVLYRFNLYCLPARYEIGSTCAFFPFEH
jgi:hypothetical protein